MDIRRFTLSNGIGVIAVLRPASPTVALQVWFRGGNRVERDGEINVAHLFEHLFFRGGRDFPDCRSVERELRLLGGISNALTADEFLCAYIVTSPRHLWRAGHLLSDTVLYTKCEENDFEKEKAAVVQELKKTIDEPEDFSERKFRQAIFGTHPLGRLDFEKLDVLGRLTRRDVLSYKERFCGAANALITVVGAINPEETAEMLEEFFREMPAAKAVVRPPFVEDVTLPAAECIARPGVEQAHLHIGALSPSAVSPDFRPSLLLHEILSHRLWLRVRLDEGLAYAAFSESRAFSDAGYFLVYAGVAPSREAILKAAGIIFQEMADMKSGNISPEEIEEAKSVLHAQLDLGLETSSQLGFFLATQQLLSGDIKTPSEIHDEIDCITKENLARLAGSLWQEEKIRSLLLTSSFPGYEKKFVRLRKILGGSP